MAQPPRFKKQILLLPEKQISKNKFCCFHWEMGLEVVLIENDRGQLCVITCNCVTFDHFHWEIGLEVVLIDNDIVEPFNGTASEVRKTNFAATNHSLASCNRHQTLENQTDKMAWDLPMTKNRCVWTSKRVLLFEERSVKMIDSSKRYCWVTRVYMLLKGAIKKGVNKV